MGKIQNGSLLLISISIICKSPGDIKVRVRNIFAENIKKENSTARKFCYKNNVNEFNSV